MRRACEPQITDSHRGLLGYETAGDSDTESYYSATELEPDVSKPNVVVKLQPVSCDGQYVQTWYEYMLISQKFLWSVV